MICFAASGEHGLLRASAAGQMHPERRVRRTARLREPSHEGHLLELCILQVHFHLRRAQRAEAGGGGALVLVVHAARLPPPPGAAGQRAG